MIRIISGTYRHRHINQPVSDQVRPTMDRIRESIFSALGPIAGQDVLDLFSGSGAYGFESLSRDANHVVFVDALKLSTQAIRQTIDELQIPESKYLIILDDYVQALNNLASHPFDLVFADPPYIMKKVGEKLLSTLWELKMLSPNAKIVIESPEEPAKNENFVSKTYRYGKKFVTIYRRIK